MPKVLKGLPARIGRVIPASATLSVNNLLMAITITGWGASDQEIWDALKEQLALRLYDLSRQPYQPAVSYRNYNCYTAALMRDPSQPRGPVTIFIGANCSPGKGSQRLCAERQTAFRALYAGPVSLVPFGAVTGNEPQPDDNTGLQSSTGVLLTCDDCRAELPLFGWPPEMPMWFFHIKDPTIAEEITFGKILADYRPHDEAIGTKASRRATGVPA